jgi:hypothetical protein
MSSIELGPRTGLATPAEINKYQRKVGSLLFAAVTTRPDIAFATSRLARYMLNPGPAHHAAADHQGDIKASNKAPTRGYPQPLAAARGPTRNNLS